jgi:RIP homotypic interaction motif
VTGVEVIVTALAAGAAAGSTDVAKSAISDTYTGLKSLLRRRLTGRERAQEALEAVETEPGRWQALLGDDLAESGAATDEQVITAARRLLTLTDPDGTAATKYRVSADHAKGVQLGDHNTQTNTFN